MAAGSSALLHALDRSRSISRPRSSVVAAPSSISLFIATAISGEALSMSAASVEATASNRSGSTTRFTRPQFSAWRADRKFPVSESSLARLTPISRGSLCDNPQPGRTPTRAWVSAKRAVSQSDQKITCQRQFKAAGDRRTVDRADNGTRKTPQRGDGVGSPAGSSVDARSPETPNSLRSRPRRTPCRRQHDQDTRASVVLRATTRSWRQAGQA